MTIQTNTLRPGLLVSLKTSVAGNVRYSKQTLEDAHIVDGGAQKARWETVRTIIDPAEHEKAKKARSKASGLIRGVCAESAFGLLCPEGDAQKLEQATAEARKIAEDFNADAKLSRISIFVITGRVSPDDVEALKAINSEVRDLMDEMQRGLKALDVKAVREAASKAKEVGAMLSDEYEARVQIAVEAARTAAKKIVQAGDTGAEIDEAAIRKIASVRTAFLDLDEGKPVQAPVPTAAVIDLAAE